MFALEDEDCHSMLNWKMALGSYAFPTQSVEIHNFIGDYLENRDRKDIAEQFFLDRFFMNLQSLERTYIDKIFALCDYYIAGENQKDIPDIYMIFINSRLSLLLMMSLLYW